MNNLEAVQALYKAFAAKDRERILQIFHPEIVWIQNEGFPGGGTYIGAETVLNDVFASFRVQWDEWKADVTRWLDAGDAIVALGEYRGVYKGTGKPMKAAFAHTYWLNEGRIVRFEQYTDTYKIFEATV